MNPKIQSLLRDNIRNLRPYSSARTEFKGVAHTFLDANENPYKWEYSRYPDPLALKLKKQISNLKKLQIEHIFTGNGSDEAIDLLIRAFCSPGKDAIRVLDPSYGMYEVSAAINDIEIFRSPLDKSFGLDPKFPETEWKKNEKILFLCSPNNPSGNCLDPIITRRIIDSYPGIVVIDEAYIDFADMPSLLPLIEQVDNLVILQTLSKASASAGLRLGMAFAQKDIIDILNKIKPPYNISQVAQNEAMIQLSNQQRITAQIQEIKKERTYLTESLTELDVVIKIFTSEANFVLVRVRNADAIYKYLADQGIIVRKRHGMLHCDNTIRITVGTPAENKQLLLTLQTFNNETRG